MTFFLRLSTLVILLALASQFIAQVSSQNQIWKDWENQDFPDTIRYSALAQHLGNNMGRNVDSIRLETERFRQIAIDEGSKIGEAKLMSIISQTWERLGQNEKRDSSAKAFLQFSQEIGYLNGVSDYWMSEGAFAQRNGNAQKAIEMYRKSHSIWAENGIEKEMGASLLHNIGYAYNMIGDNENSFKYYKLSLAKRRFFEDSVQIMYSLNNLGYNFMNIGEWDSARVYLEEQVKIARDLNHEQMLGYGLINLASVEAQDSTQVDPRGMLSECKEIFKRTNDMMAYHSADFVLMKYQQVIGEYNACIDLGHELILVPPFAQNTFQLLQIYQELETCYSSNRQFEEALACVDKLDSLRGLSQTTASAVELENWAAQRKALTDSIAMAGNIAIMQGEHAENLGQRTSQRNLFIWSGLGALLLAILIFFRWRKTNREKEASDEILENVLPSDITEELKAKGMANAKNFDSATILFSDFAGFTALSEELGPEALVAEIDVCFQAFDRITDKYNIEKIKTIGDSYMAAGGLREPVTASPADIVKAALEMQEFMLNRKKQRDLEGLKAFEMRIGIHTGPVVAGIVGVKKFQYDVWGDTVNTASRMESSGAIGHVNISQSTYDLVQNDPDLFFSSRGKVQAKGKGEMEMYFVTKALVADS